MSSKCKIAMGIGLYGAIGLAVTAWSLYRAERGEQSFVGIGSDSSGHHATKAHVLLLENVLLWPIAIYDMYAPAPKQNS